MTLILGMSQKVTARHVQRQAMLYVRQSTLHQVLENTESTARQYALRERAIALGWPTERVVVIDQDLGQSGASAVDREGFQRLVAEVGLGHVGLVMGLEVSRLARSSLDWHHLLELCSMTGTLILDEDGLYDPATFNDRLLLGMKGTMSEAELHMLRARLRGGILNQAQRAALKLQLPVGLVYVEDKTVHLDPDAQVQHAFRVLFATFKRTGSAWATVKYFREQQLLFPHRIRTGPHAGTIHWSALTHNGVLKILRNPRYAGAFCYGRTHMSKGLDGSLHVETVPQEEWPFLFQDVHVGYITWEEFEANSSATAAEPSGLWWRPKTWPSTRRASTLARVGHLRKMRKSHDGALSSSRAWNTTHSRIRVSEGTDRACHRGNLSAYSGCGARCDHC